MKKSAGIVPFRIKNGRLQVYLAHLGGPFWKKKKRSWGIIKGEMQKDEEPLQTAKREFFEETGKRIAGEFIDLGEAKSSNKILHIFAIEKELDKDVHSNMVRMQYGGKRLEFPEIDKAAWFDIDEAEDVIIASQKIFLQRLKERLAK